MNFKKIEIIKTDERVFTVRIDDLYADHLMVEEALGVIASALFGEKPIFLRTADEWKKLEESYSEKHMGPTMEWDGGA